MPRHFASWGFIVIGTEEENAWNGFGAEMSVRHLERLDQSPQPEEGKANIFYQKIDLSRVGIVGHSQGGVGVFNAVTAQPHGELYQAAAALSPTNKELAHSIEWAYDPSLIHIPVLLAAGAGGGDDWVVTGEQMESIYDGITADKVLLRRKNTVHNKVLCTANGYVTACFRWHLQDDQEARRIFDGAEPDILSNPLYQGKRMELG